MTLFSIENINVMGHKTPNSMEIYLWHTTDIVMFQIYFDSNKTITELFLHFHDLLQ